MPKALAAAGVDPRDVIGIGTDFTACTVLPTARRRHAAVRAAGPTRDRPHAYLKLWKHHAAQPQADRINALAARARREPWLARYGGRISSEWEFAKALQLLEEDPEVYAPHRALDRGGRLDRLAALRRRDAQRLHRGLQGHPTRTAATPVADYLAGAATRTSPTSSTEKLEHPIAPLGDRAGGLTAAGGRRGPGCPRASRWPSATSTRTSPCRPRRRSSPARWSRSWAPRPAT